MMSSEAVKYESTPQEVIIGVVERIRYYNEANGFLVASVREAKRSVPIVGYIPSVQPGQHVEARGVWHNDPKWGLQFKAETISFALPSSRESVVKYLSSGVVKGLGPRTAERLYEAFGARLFQVLDEGRIEELTKVDKIGEATAAKILKGWEAQKAIREIMVFLQEHGIGPTRAVKIYKTYGNDAIRLISENPYRLAYDIRGVGFLTSDALAMRLGIDKEAPFRVRAGAVYVLSEATGNGHCALPRETLVSKSVELLGVGVDAAEAAIEAEIRAETIVGGFIEDVPCVWPTWAYRSEKTIGERVAQLNALPVPWDTEEAKSYIDMAADVNGFALATLQREAVAMAVTSKISVITGGPGVGKTATTKTILTILDSMGLTACLAAPTGRAAKRLAESAGMEAKTIHRLLEFNPEEGFRRNRRNPLDCELLLVDEASMVDVPLMNALLNAVPDKAAVILVGDVDQLPSVGPGQVLAHFIDSGVVPVTRMTEIFRQAADSAIITSAHAINRGSVPDLSTVSTSDFQFYSVETPEECATRVLTLIQRTLPEKGFDPIRDIQVLCPMNRGGAGAHSLNVAIQKMLVARGGPTAHCGGFSYCVGDKVIQTENDYDKQVYNGDIGFVTRIDLEEGEVYVLFDQSEVCYEMAELDSLMPAYALSVHKSQGSEYPVVIIPLTTQHYPMLQRNLLYTGVTRGKKLVILVGQKKAVGIAVRGNPGGHKRWSNLRYFLRKGGADAPGAVAPAPTKTHGSLF